VQRGEDAEVVGRPHASRYCSQPPPSGQAAISSAHVRRRRASASEPDGRTITHPVRRSGRQPRR
jgi:hypothetical protein